MGQYEKRNKKVVRGGKKVGEVNSFKENMKAKTIRYASNTINTQQAVGIETN